MGEELADVVRAAREGSPDAWRELVARFQDVAVAMALGWTGDVAAAQDMAQDAFGLAFRHLPELDDAAAFPAWFRRLVRTALSRRARGREAVRVARREGGGNDGDDPAAIVERDVEASRVRRAVEALPEGERAVIALHYLAGLPYPDVAAFLDIGVSAARKRAFAGRRRLRGLLPIVEDFVRAARPSGFRPTVALFRAVRRRDAGAVGRLLDRRPALAGATEDWTLDEAVAAELPPASHATPLVRAAGAGDAAVVRALLDRGADVNAACGCVGGETPLWAATAVGAVDVVALLLVAGTDPNRPAFRGATPLHVATQRGDRDMIELLVSHRADPERRDGGGRTPRSWLRCGRRPAAGVVAARPAAVATGVRVIDLLAPLHRGCVQRWHADHGVGRLVVVIEVARAAGAACCWIGFEQDLVGTEDVAHGMAEMGTAGRVALVERDAAEAAARERFHEAVGAVLAGSASREPRVVVCMEAPGYAHDVAAALPSLRGAPGVLATLVLAPPGDAPAAGTPLPEGYDGRVCFDRARAARGLYPAIDPATTASRRYPNERHARLAAGARTRLVAGDARFDALMAQPFPTTEPFSSTPGQSTPPEDVLAAVERLLTGRDD